MTPTDIRLVHVAPRIQARGGIETMVGYNREMQLKQRFVALFDRHPEARDDYENLDITWRTPIFEIRRRFRRALGPHHGSVVVHHNGWGLPLLHDLDGAARRIVMLHGDPAYHRDDLGCWNGMLDGAMGCCPGFTNLWPELLPAISPDRLGVFRIPIDRRLLTGADMPAPRARKPVVLGYAGRVVRTQKRMDLLPLLERELGRCGVDYRFEVVGDGPLAGWLSKRVSDRVRLHGWIESREEFVRVLGKWDGAVYFSDHEGGPIGLMEAMAAGAVPFFPRIGGSWGDCYAPKVDPLCHYPQANMGALAEAIRDVFGRSEAEIATLGATARRLVADHADEHYKAGFAGMVGRIAGMPRLSTRRARRPRVSDLLPLGMVARFAPWALRRG